MLRETFLQRALDEGKAVDTSIMFGIAIDGHREALLRALCNLIDNALRFTPCGGRVDVTVGRLDTCVEVSIADAGPGLPAGAQAVLCGARDGGAALPGRLGLAIVAEVARLHGAAVDVAASAAGTRIALRFAPSTAAG
jgi:signal transduction histidine kinase